MQLSRLHVASQRVVGCFGIALLLGIIGCGTMPTSFPSASLPTNSTATNKFTTGPILGYAWDGVVQGLRPILGVPGAAQFGSPVFAGSGYNNGRACVARKYALLTNSSGQAFVAALPSGTPLQIAEHLAAKAQIAISPSCTAALFYAPGTSSATLVLGLPQSAKVQSLDISHTGGVIAANVSDTGLILVASAQANQGTTVQAISADGTVTQVAVLAGLGGMAFLPTGQDALIGDSGRSTIWLASNLPSNSALNRVAATADGVTQPTSVGASRDGRWLIVANQDGTILRIDLSRQTAPSKVVCSSCTATKLIPLNSNSTFLLSDATSGPIWTFDGDSPSPRIVFIPAIQPTNAAGASR